MGKKIAFLTADGYEDMEHHYPFIRLKEAGHTPVLIGLQKGLIKGKNGYPANVEVSIDDANPEEYDGVVVPGGLTSPDLLRRNQKIVDFVANINAAGKLVASICHGPWLLISAKVLKGKKSTCFFAIKDDVINAGSQYHDVEVITDGNLITSRMPVDLPAFMKEILKFLG